MRPTRTSVLLTAGLVTLLGVPAAAAAAAETPSTLYVSNRSGSNCADTGPGSQAVPFCTVSAAAKVVEPGQTVRIKAGTYPESVTIDRSGLPGKPITFDGELIQGLPETDLDGSKGLTISGASHVVVRGLGTHGGVQVSRSSTVELDRLDVSNGTLDGIVITDASTDVRVTRGRLVGVRIDGGSQRTVLGRNEILSYDAPAVTAVDAPGTIVTNNQLSPDCGTAASLSGASTGSALFNNLVYPYVFAPCPAGGTGTGFSVSQSAASGTRADYNLLIDGSTSQLKAYEWAGTSYETAAALQAATGQGAHDILVPKAFGVVDGVDGSPAIDSGDPTAPGVLPSDFRYQPTADDPRVPNTGKDGGHIDRGARETQDNLSSLSTGVTPAWAPTGTPVTATASTDSKWAAALTYRYDFGDGTAPVTTKERTAQHVYTKACSCVVKVTAVNALGKTVSAEQAIRVTAAGPLTADFTATPVLPTSADPTRFIAPLTTTIDPQQASATPWPVQRAEVSFGDGTHANSDHLRAFTHTYSLPGDYKVTVLLQDSRGVTSTVSRDVKVDYAPSGYVATTPFRALDTRTTNTPLQGGSATPVSLPAGVNADGHVLSGSMAAAVLNVTVTDATEDTHLTVWPAGQPRPATSNVNVRAGGTSSNTVTVPVAAYNKLTAQLNAGRATLIVDFVGYYQPTIGQRFSPVTPTRLVDTRAAGGPLGGGQTRTVKVAGVNGIPADASAVALNLTSTGSTANAFVSAYPDPAKRPATSNLNPEPGQDKSNQAIVPVGPNGTVTLYTNAGATDLILDAVGYYGKNGKALFTPVVPQRIADTRTTGKLAPGATGTVAGIPAGALGAVVNVTATETTAPGYLTVFGHGGVRPEASSLNTRPGATVPNHVTTPVASGRISVFNSWGGSNHVITDLLGYFTQG